MAYTALYRRFRPDNFTGLIGQNHIAKILAAAVSRGNFVHAYLFCGPRGTGKTSAARIFARAINCQNPLPDGNPCDCCASCLRVKKGESLDIIEIDGASNRGIDEIRDLRERVKYSPAQERYKIYIIDEVHMLTNEAFNAILKTLEEPPTHVIFIFATTAPHKLPLTVLSRCQRFDFRRIGAEKITDHLLHIAATENIRLDRDAAALIAKKADGGMRDAVSLLDQCASATEGLIDTETVNTLLGTVDHGFILRLRDHFLDGDISAVLVDVDQIVNAGKDLRQAAGDLSETLRDGLLVKLANEKSSPYPVATWLKRLSALADIDTKLRLAASPRVTFELALIKACTLSDSSVPPHPAEVQASPSAGDSLTAAYSSAVAEKKLPKDEQDSGQPKAEDKEPLSRKIFPSINPASQRDSAADLRQTPSVESFDGGKIVKLWPSILKRIEMLNSSTFFRVENCRIVQIGADQLLLEFPQDRRNDFNYVMDNKDQRATLDTAISLVCGQRYRLQARLGNFTVPNEDEFLPPDLLKTSSEEDTEPEQTSLFK